MNIIKPALFIALIFGTLSLYANGQSLKQDSVRIESQFLQAIGKPAVIDSLQKIELQNIRKKKGSYILEETYWYNLSKARFLSGQLDEAFQAANSGIALCLKNKNDYKTAKFHNLKASVYAYKKDNQQAIAEFKTSLAILEKVNDAHTAAQIQNNIANIFFGLSDFKSANTHALKSYEQLSKEKDSIHLPAVTGILAITSLKLNHIKKGKTLAKKALYLANKYNNPIGQIVGNHAMGELYISEKKYDKAISSFDSSLILSELYQQTHFVMLNKLGLQHTLLLDKKYTESIQNGKQALELTNSLNNENTLYAIHKNLSYAYAGLGKNEEAFKNLALAHDIYIESAGIENQKAINDILIKYDTEKKEKELVLNQLTLSENQNKLYKQAQWIVLLALLLFIVLTSYYFYNRLQKHRIENLKKEEETKRMLASISAEEKERERISNELHDGMASVITGLKMKLEVLSKNPESEVLKPFVTQLGNLHDETRRISHNLMPLGLDDKNWLDRIEQYCRENSSSAFVIHFQNTIKKHFLLDPSISIIIYRSIQELIHNVQKHAQSKVCHVQSGIVDNELVLTVEDEGIGFSEKDNNAQGLNSMRKRLHDIGARLEIESKPGEGTLSMIYLKH